MKKVGLVLISIMVVIALRTYCWDKCPICAGRAEQVGVDDRPISCVVVEGKCLEGTIQGLTYGIFVCPKGHIWECLLGGFEE